MVYKLSDNMMAIIENFNKYQNLYFEKFGCYAESWFTYLKWLSDCNNGHTFQPIETKKAIELFEDFNKSLNKKC